MSLTKKDEAIYLDGLRKMMGRGVDIYIDGIVSSGDDLGQILIISDSSYYMGDYIEEPSTGRLKEIHFDLVAHTDPPCF